MIIKPVAAAVLTLLTHATIAADKPNIVHIVADELG
jgi:hypothetical protein